MIEYFLLFIFGLYIGTMWGIKRKEQEARKYKKLYFNRWRATRTKR
jgi:hypothetical protein